jgi:ABC-type transport system involved in multi-copper enzyme maturation permease subunit
MPAFWLDWLRRNLGWSNTRQAWEERLGLLALALAAVAGLVWGRHLTLAQHALLWGLLLAGLAVLGRRGWLKLFGPVLFYDLVCTARRRRYFFIRLLYVSVLSIVFFWMYLVFSLSREYQGHSVKDSAQFAETFFFTFTWLEFLLVGILTPAYTAGAIADEKDRRTLEFLLATDLRNREIVLSKMATRLLNLTMLVLAGLPIFGFTQFFGGIDPNLLLVSFATLGLTMLSLAALSILSSVLMKKPRDAIVLTYLVAVTYLGLASMSWLLLLVPGAAGAAVWFGSNPATVQDLVEWANAGNLPASIVRMVNAYERGRGLPDVLPGLLTQYAVFHGLVAVCCTTVAVLRLRAVALKQSYGKVQKSSLAVRWWGRPRVGTQPMLWKEILVEPGLRFGWLGRAFVALLILGSFIPAVIIIVQYLEAVFGGSGGRRVWGNPWDLLQQEMNVWVRILGTAAACLMLLAVAVRASGTVSGERDRQTFDGLLTTPLESNTILFAKWLGALLSVRWAWLWVGSIWFLGLVTGGVHPLAVPLLPIAWLVYAAMFATVGIWFSIVCRTTLRSTLWTLVTVLGMSVGHWLLSSMCCFMPLSLLANVRGHTLDYLAKLEFGQTPPLVLGLFAFSGRELDNDFGRKDTIELIVSCLFGLACWAAAAAALWLGASLRFRAVTARLPFQRGTLAAPAVGFGVPREVATVTAIHRPADGIASLSQPPDGKGGATGVKEIDRGS